MSKQQNVINNDQPNWILEIRKVTVGTSLVAQWLRLCAPNAGSLGSISDQGTRSHMHATTKSSHAATKGPACHN